MNIKQFKIGDIITRNEPMKYKHNGTEDGSYLGDKIVFLGLDEEAKIIFFKHPFFHEDEPSDLSYARDAWDEGWAFYPQGVFDRAKEFMKTFSNNQQP